jgi:esterase/lipase superfamily enzyme
MRRFAFFAILTLAAPAAFSSSPLQDVTPGPDFSTVKVFYATDRAFTGAAGPTDMFGYEQAQPPTITYGTAQISIPRGHQPGIMDEPRVWKGQFWSNPARDIVLLATERVDGQAFFKAVAERAALSSRHGVLVVVHGFWTDFNEAVRRAAQIKYDLNFDGPTVVYSWPSLNAARLYFADEKNAEWAIPHLRDLLAQLQNSVGSASVNIIAHSLGNRIAVHALQLLSNSGAAGTHFDQVILTAPDIDAPTFIELQPDIVRLCRRLTLYASSHDQALWVSKTLHTGHRAGEAGAGIIILPDMDTIDVGDVDGSWLGHSYVFENITVITDIAYCLRGESPQERCRLVQKQPPNRYWMLSEIVANGVVCTLR